MSKFKVGDRVRVAGCCGRSFAPVGSQAVIREVDGDGRLQAEMEAEHDGWPVGELWWFSEGDLELAAPAEDPALAYLKREIAAGAAAGSNKPGSFLFERHDELARMLREVYGLRLSTEPQFVPVSA